MKNFSLNQLSTNNRALCIVHCQPNKHCALSTVNHPSIVSHHLTRLVFAIALLLCTHSVWGVTSSLAISTTSPYFSGDGWTTNANAVYSGPYVKCDADEKYVQFVGSNIAITKFDFTYKPMTSTSCSGHSKTAWATGSIKVWASSNGTDFTELSAKEVSWNGSGASDVNVNLTFEQASNYVGVKVQFAKDCGNVGLKNFTATYEEGSSCAAPTDPQNGATTKNSQAVSWTDATGSNWEVYYSTSSTAPEASATPTATVSNNSYTFTGLTPSTTYYWWVRTKCSESSKSTWVAGSSSFTTSAITWTDYLTECCVERGITLADGGKKDDNKNTFAAGLAQACEDTQISLSATPNDCYTHTSWSVYKTGDQSTKIDVSDNKFTMPGYAVTVDATFTIKQYTITYNTDGGTHETEKYNAVTVNCGNAWTAPADPSKVGGHFIGWKDSENNTYGGYGVGQFTPTKSTILTAQWETAVSAVTLHMAGDQHKNLNIGETNQMYVTYTPESPQYGGSISSWVSSNTQILTVTSDGLVTALKAGTATITATSANGISSDPYSITVNSSACDSWKVTYWQNGSGDKHEACFSQVGETTEWRCDFVLPSVADWFSIGQTGGDNKYSKDWTWNGVTTIGLQSNNEATKYYPGQDAEGYLRIYSNSTSDNYYVAFEPIYQILYGVDGGSDPWTALTLSKTIDHEYETGLIQVPDGYFGNDNFKFYVGTKRQGSTSPFINSKSATTKLKEMSGLTSDLAGKFGKYHIYDNSNDANWYCSFIRYYQLSYDANNGTGSTDPQYISSLAEGGAQQVTLKANPFTRDGYEFLYYTTDQAGAGEHFSPSSTYSLNSSTGDVTMYAQWKKIQTTLNLKANDPASPSAEDVVVTATYNEALPAFTSHSKTGHTLTGYFTASTEGTKVINSDGTLVAGVDGYTTAEGKWQRVDASLDLYAQWTVNTYLLTYYEKGGLTPVEQSTHNNPLSYTYGVGIASLNSYVKLGYDFGGWYLNSGCTGDQVTAISKTEIGDKSLYANISIHNYLITYEGLEGATNPNPTSYTVSSAFALQDPGDRAGYRFDKWTCGGNPITQISSGSTGDKTITANWVKTYTVTYQNGDAVLSGYPKTVDAGTELGTLPEIGDLKSCRATTDVFKGWSTSKIIIPQADAPTTVTSATTVDADMVIYAVWAQASGGEEIVERTGTINATASNLSSTSIKDSQDASSTIVSLTKYKGYSSSNPSSSTSKIELNKTATNNKIGNYIQFTAGTNITIKSIVMTNATYDATTGALYVGTTTDGNVTWSNSSAVAEGGSYSATNLSTNNVCIGNNGSATWTVKSITVTVDKTISTTTYSNYITYCNTNPYCYVTPDTKNFGDVDIYSTTEQEFTFDFGNLTGDLSIAVVGEGFSLKDGQSATITNTGTSTTRSIVFAPDAVKDYAGTMTISGGGLADNVVINLSGHGLGYSFVVSVRDEGEQVVDAGTISANIAGRALVITDGVAYAPANASVTLSQEPKSGYEFVSWKFYHNDPAEVWSTSNPFTMPADNTVKAYAIYRENPCEPSTLTVKTNPTKTTFTEGETFSAAGLVLTISYTDPLTCSPTYVTDNYTTDYDGHVFTESEAGQHTVTVTHQHGLTTTYSITVNALARNIYKDMMHGGDDQRITGSHDMPALTDKEVATSGTYAKQHFHFVGWTTDEYKDAPTGHVTNAGTPTTADGTIYIAVWAKADVSVPFTYEATTQTATLSDGLYIIERGSLVAANSISSNYLSTTSSYVKTQIPSDASYIWELTKSGDDYYIKVNGANKWMNWKESTQSTFATSLANAHLWNIAANGSTWAISRQCGTTNRKWYVDDSAIKLGNVTSNKDFTLYKLSANYSFTDYACRPLYTLTYNANEATSGTAPASQTGREGNQVTVSGNTGSLIKTNAEFGGWNTSADGSGDSYAAGSTYTFGAADATLFAKWSECTVTGISLNTDNVTKTYYVGKSGFSTEGLIVTVNYSNCESQTTTSYTSSITDGHVFTAGEVGQQTVTITSNEQKAQYTIDVQLPPAVVTATPNTADYVYVKDATPASREIVVAWEEMTTPNITLSTLTYFDANYNSETQKITITPKSTTTTGVYNETLTITAQDALQTKTTNVTVKMSVVAKPTTSGIFRQITDGLTTGDYIIVAATSNVAMNKTVDNRFKYENVAIVANDTYNEITINPMDPQNIIWHIEQVGDNWVIADATGLAASTGASGKAQLLTDDNEGKVLWTSTSVGVFTNVYNTAKPENATLRFNSGNGFATYSAEFGEGLRLFKFNCNVPMAVITSAVNPAAAGTVTMTHNDQVIESGTEVMSGMQITLSQEPADGYQFREWSVSGDGASLEGNVLTMGSVPTTVTANYDQLYTIEKVITPSAGGSMTISATEAIAGATINITGVAANAGYALTSVMANGTPVEITDGAGSFTMPNANVTVTATFSPILVSGITLSATSATKRQEETYQITATILPADALNKTIEWTSSNSSIASVEKKNATQAIVTAVAPGVVTITAAAQDGSAVSASCEFTVTESNYYIYIDEMHGNTSATFEGVPRDIGPDHPIRGSHKVPSLENEEVSSEGCAAAHWYFVGWREDAISPEDAKDTMPTNVKTAGSQANPNSAAQPKTFYAVWAVAQE